MAIKNLSFQMSSGSDDVSARLNNTFCIINFSACKWRAVGWHGIMRPLPFLILLLRVFWLRDIIASNVI